MTSHPAIQARLAQWRQDRADYAIHMEGVYRAAEEATNANLLNRRGWAARVDPWSLFVGPGHHMRLRAYGSPELLEWVTAHPVVTFQDWERQRGRVPGRQWGACIRWADDEWPKVYAAQAMADLEAWGEATA